MVWSGTLQRKCVDFFDISVLGRPVLSEQEQIKLFDENYSYLPINRRLKQIYKRFLYLLRPIKKTAGARMFDRGSV